MTSDTYVFHTSRTEIADAVVGAFADRRHPDRDELLAAAEQAHAPTEVRLALASLDAERRYPELRALWPDLPDMPIERA